MPVFPGRTSRLAGCQLGSIGPVPITPCASSMRQVRWSAGSLRAHPDGLKILVSRLARAGSAEVAIERGDGKVVGALPAGVTVVVITPQQVKNLRSRYGSAGNEDDRPAGYVLADVLRTDRARLRPLIPDSPAKAHAAAGLPGSKDLVRHPGCGGQPAAHPPVVRVPLRLACSASSTRRSAWHSWPVPTARTASAGCRETAGRLAESRQLQRPHRPSALVADDAIARLHRVANGLPRALNNAAVAALIAAAAGKDLVDDACA